MYNKTYMKPLLKQNYMNFREPTRLRKSSLNIVHVLVYQIMDRIGILRHCFQLLSKSLSTAQHRQCFVLSTGAVEKCDNVPTSPGKFKYLSWKVLEKGFKY